MDKIQRCEECGSWDRQCVSDTPVDGCGCVRCAGVTIVDLERQLAEANQLKQEAIDAMVQYENQLAEALVEIAKLELACEVHEAFDVKQKHEIDRLQGILRDKI